MVKRLVLKPDGWRCTLSECRPGLFVYDGYAVGLKTAYFKADGSSQAYCGNGEAFYAGGKADEVEVQPVAAEWEDED